jgi:hypothetical protein
MYGANIIRKKLHGSLILVIWREDLESWLKSAFKVENGRCFKFQCNDKMKILTNVFRIVFTSILQYTSYACNWYLPYWQAATSVAFPLKWGVFRTSFREANTLCITFMILPFECFFCIVMYCLCSLELIRFVLMKWLRYQIVISLETEVGNTSQRNKWVTRTPRHTGGGIRSLGGVKCKS